MKLIVQVVGPVGSGKTQKLEEIENRLEKLNIYYERDIKNEHELHIYPVGSEKTQTVAMYIEDIHTRLVRIESPIQLNIVADVNATPAAGMAILSEDQLQESQKMDKSQKMLLEVSVSGHTYNEDAPLSANAYQGAAMTTKKELGFVNNLHHAMYGMMDETGELANAIKANLVYGKNLDKLNVIEELGDNLWFASLMADTLGVPLAVVMEANIAKLQVRYQEGYADAKALGRVTELEREAIANVLTKYGIEY